MFWKKGLTTFLLAALAMVTSINVCLMAANLDCGHNSMAMSDSGSQMPVCIISFSSAYPSTLAGTIELAVVFLCFGFSFRALQALVSMEALDESVATSKFWIRRHRHSFALDVISRMFARGILHPKEFA